MENAPMGGGGVGPGRDDEIDGFGIVGHGDILRRRLVGVHSIRTGVVDAEEIEVPLAEFCRHTADLLGRNLIISNLIICDRAAATFFAGNARVISPSCPVRIPQHS